MPTHYEVLGIEQGASREDVRRAYLGLMRLVHPDSQAARINHVVVAASEINHAYTVLKKPQTRMAYDEKLALDRFPLRMLARIPPRSSFFADGFRAMTLTTLLLLIAFSTWSDLAGSDGFAIANDSSKRPMVSPQGPELDGPELARVTHR